jgi:hypothetical protein
MTKKLLIDIIAKDKTKQALNGVQKNLSNVKNSVFSLKGALVGLGAGAIVKSFVDVGKEVESLQVRFKFLFGSIEEGKVAFDSLTDFAGRVPFSLEEISRASGNLAVVAKDAQDLNRVLEITGNVAAVTGLDFETTSSQIQRAFSGGIGAADLFRERGVRALLGFQNGAKVTAEETIARFEELFAGDGQFASATKDLATTLEGTLSMIGDKYFKFQKDVASGFFDELKGEFGDLNVFLEQNEQQIKDIATAIGENFAGALTRTSETIKGVAPAVKTISNALGSTIQGFASLPPFVQNVGLVGALLFGKKGAVALAGVSFFFDKITDFIDKVKNEKNLEELLKLPNDELLESVKSLEDINELISFTEPKLIKIKGKIIETNTQYKEQNELLKELRNQINNNNLAIEHGTKVGSQFANALGKIDVQAKNSNEQLKEMTRTTNKMVVIGGMVGEQFQKALESMGEGVDTITEDKFPRFKQALEDAGNTTLQLDNLFTNTFNSFTDTLADSIMTGKFAFKDFARSVIADIARIIARQQALIAIQKISGLFGGSLFGFNIGGLLPARSSGGRVNAGMPVTVGEAGKEIFVPQSSGTIIPNNQAGGSTNINFTINTVDAQGVDELLTNRRSTIINVINDALNRQGKEALV